MLSFRYVTGFILFILMVVFSPTGRAEPTPENALLILSKTEQTLAIVDPVSLRVIARLPVGPDPHEVIASTDGKYAYVTNYGGGAYHSIAVLDLVAQKALPSIELGALRGPHGIVYGGGKVWFTAEAANVIGSYDPTTQKIDFVFGTGQRRTHMLIVTDALSPIYTTNIGSASLSVIEKVGSRPGREDWDQTLIPVGKGPEGFDLHPNGKEIWVANSQDGTVSVIDLATRKVTHTIQANVKSANRLKFTPDGKLAFISMLTGSEAVVIDVATQREIKRIKLGRGAAGIQMQPDGKRVFIASTPDDFVAVIDMETLNVVGRLDVGKNPDGMAWAVRR